MNSIAIIVYHSHKSVQGYDNFLWLAQLTHLSDARTNHGVSHDPVQGNDRGGDSEERTYGNIRIRVCDGTKADS